MINYITSPFRWFFKLEAASGLVLLIATVIALILSNSSLSEYLKDETDKLKRIATANIRGKTFTFGISIESN